MFKIQAQQAQKNRARNKCKCKHKAANRKQLKPNDWQSSLPGQGDHNPIYALIALFMSNAGHRESGAVCLADREQAWNEQRNSPIERNIRGQNTWLVRARKSTTNQSVKAPHGLFCVFFSVLWREGHSHMMDWPVLSLILDLVLGGGSAKFRRLWMFISSLISRGELTKEEAVSEFALIMAWFMTQLPFNSPDRIQVLGLTLISKNVLSSAREMLLLVRHTSLAGGYSHHSLGNLIFFNIISLPGYSFHCLCS